ncbi:hypothetical protein Glove_633g3 [Diversispora epigaea]|uniref:Uncharacterized protein n=1 Tax=Diversispora epigaea TaxID=1348612 RepID=A0A397GAY7_9GLOM|nr:hypothetical protein Glove_633g3 [Diversispora epigaea]
MNTNNRAKNDMIFHKSEKSSSTSHIDIDLLDPKYLIVMIVVLTYTNIWKGYCLKMKKNEKETKVGGATLICIVMRIYEYDKKLGGK